MNNLQSIKKNIILKFRYKTLNWQNLKQFNKSKKKSIKVVLIKLKKDDSTKILN